MAPRRSCQGRGSGRRQQRRLRPSLKICDFGYSKNEFVDSRPKSVSGTPDYIAPEVLQSQDASLVIPPLLGALLKTEQDVALFEKLALAQRQRR